MDTKKYELEVSGSTTPFIDYKRMAEDLTKQIELVSTLSRLHLLFMKNQDLDKENIELKAEVERKDKLLREAITILGLLGLTREGDFYVVHELRERLKKGLNNVVSPKKLQYGTE